MVTKISYFGHQNKLFWSTLTIHLQINYLQNAKNSLLSPMPEKQDGREKHVSSENGEVFLWQTDEGECFLTRHRFLWPGLLATHRNRGEQDGHICKYLSKPQTTETVTSRFLQEAKSEFFSFQTMAISVFIRKFAHYLYI